VVAGSAPELKFAGYDLIVIEGKAEKPVYCWISDGKCEIKDVSHLWGMTTEETHRLALNQGVCW